MSVLAIVASVALLALCAALRPHAARCPAGMDLRTGIRDDGSYQCWPHPVGDPEWDGTWQRPERSVQAAWVLEGRVYCTGTEIAIVIDHRTAGCQQQQGN